jgi:hypothetical protein
MAPESSFRSRPALAVVCALLAAYTLAALPGLARAADPGIPVRLYYSHWMDGHLKETPLDPQGQFSDLAPLHRNDKLELEAIFWQHAGLSYSRQRVEREFVVPSTLLPCGAPNCAVRELSVQQSLNLTLYARAVDHNQLNLFAGGGAGKADYDQSINDVAKSGGGLFEGMALTRWFYGVDVTFQRIGFRVEVSNARASKSAPGQSVRLDETFRYLTLIIPLN